MEVSFIRTTSEHLDELPIVDGQIIVLRDREAMYYDTDGLRHSVKAPSISSGTADPNPEAGRDGDIYIKILPEASGDQEQV